MVDNSKFAKINNKLGSIFYRIEIRKLYIMLFLFFCTVFISVYIVTTYHKIYSTIYQERITQLRYVADFAVKILDGENSFVLNRQKTLRQAQRESISMLKNIRFANTDYIGVISDKNKYIYSPYPKPSEDSKMYAKINALSKRPEGGYFQYKTTDINNIKKYTTKISYVKGYNNWGWIVVTGLYIDDMNAKVISSMLGGIFPVSVVVILLILLYLYVLWATISAPTEELADKSFQLANSDLDVVIPELKYNTGFGNLYQAFRKLSEVFKEKVKKEKKLAEIIDCIGDALITADHTGTIISINPAAEKMFGYSKTGIIGKNVDLLTSPSLFSGDINDLEGIKRVYDKYELLGVKNEETFPIEVDVNRIQNNGDELFVLLIRNITNQKDIEKRKDEFVQIVFNEVKKPLTEMKESLESKLNFEFSNIEIKVKNLIEDFYGKISDLISLIDDILDIENLEAGKIEFKYEVTKVFDLIEYVISSNKALADKFKVNYQFINNMPEDTLIKIDKKRFCQILTNLLSNATKFSPINGDVIILTSIKDYSILISVKDYGTGIPYEIKDKIFTKFTRASGVEERQKGGAGLGLHICKKLIEEMNGRINFETEVGKGTTFNIGFPIYLKDSDRG